METPRPSKIIPGLNVQSPWAELIVSGRKTIETRHYPLPTKYLHVELAVIQTPGSANPGKKAQIVGTVVFSRCITYGSKQEWKADYRRHLVPENDKAFGYNSNKPKWGWVVKRVTTFPATVAPPKRRGIRFTQACR